MTGFLNRVRTALSVLMGGSSPAAITQAAPELLTPPPAAPMKISRHAIERALSAPAGPERASAFAQLFPVPSMPDWIPQGEARQETEFAFDYIDGQIGQIYGYASNGFFGEGIGFLGYPYLAELSQRPEYRLISVIRAQEMTRKWIELTYAGDTKDKAATAKINQLNDAMKRWRIQDLFREVTEHDGLFGRGQIYIDTGAGDDPAELATRLVADKAKVGKGDSNSKVKLKGFRVIEALWTYPGPWNGIDPLQADFYKPSQWWVQGKIVHESRLLIFVSRPMPDLLKAAYMFGGLSLSQMAKPYVDNWLRTRQSVSDITHAYSTMILHTDMSSILSGGDGGDLFKRLEIFNLTRDNRGVFAINKDSELFENIATPLGTLDKLQAQAQEQMCSVSQTPVVKLLGLTPSGLNTSTDGEIRSFYDMVAANQESLYRAPLKRVIDFIQLDEFGEIDPAIDFKFVPLWELDEAGEASVRKTETDTDIELIDAGVLSPEEVRAKIIADPNSPYAGLDPDDLPEPPEEPDPTMLPDPAKSVGEPKSVQRTSDAAWNESDHPRAENGEFGNGGAGSPAKQKKAFTEQQSIELKDYKEGGFRELNARLRSGDLGAYEGTAKTLDAALKKSSLHSDTTLYRGVKIPALANNAEKFIDKDITVAAFQSTSTDEKAASEFAGFGGGAAVLHIKVRAGTPAIDLTQFEGSGNANESEVLLGRGGKLRVTGVDRSGRIPKITAEWVGADERAQDASTESVGRLL